MTNQTNPAAPQTVRARRVIEESVAQISQALSDLTGQSMEALAARGNTEPCRIARSALALKALLSAPEGAGRALAEAAEAFHAAIVEEEGPAKPWATSPRGRFLAALAAFRASPEAIGGGRADADDMRAQRDYNAATVVRTQMEWRKALLAITPPGVTWPESKPTEIATLAEATAEIGAAHAETRKALGHVRSNVKSIVAEREAIAKERDALRAERDAANAALDKAQDGIEVQRKAIGVLRAERDRLAGDPRLTLNFLVRRGAYARGAFDSLQDATDDASLWSRDTAKGAYRVEVSDAAVSKEPREPAPAEAPREAASGVSERARLIFEAMVRVWAAIPRAAGFSVADHAFEAAEILCAAEAEAAKGGAA